MSIIRRASDGSPYTAISNTTLQDKTISLDAKGLLVYLLSKPPDWNVMSSVLMREFDIGKDRYYRMVNELQAAGYFKIIRGNDEKGHRTTEYVVSDGKLPDDTASGLAGDGQAGDGSPASGQQDTTKERKKHKGMTETKTPTGSAKATAPRGVDAQFAEVWDIYPRKIKKAEALKRFRVRIREGTPFEELKAAVVNYAALRAGQEEQFTMHPTTFFGPEAWRDYLPGGAGLTIQPLAPRQRDSAVASALEALKGYFLASPDDRVVPDDPLLGRLFKQFTPTKLSRMSNDDIRMVLIALATDSRT
jgi:adenylate kinase family enzyme